MIEECLIIYFIIRVNDQGIKVMVLKSCPKRTGCVKGRALCSLWRAGFCHNPQLWKALEVSASSLSGKSPAGTLDRS